MTRLRRYGNNKDELEKSQCLEVLATDEYLSLWKFQNPNIIS